MAPIRSAARIARQALGVPDGFLAPVAPRRMSAAWELVSRVGLSHARPSYGIDAVEIGGRTARVTEVPVASTPFGTLLNFRKDTELVQPRVLVVAPLSGHFATLLRGTVKTMLADHDVYITDWHNARDVPLSARALRLRRLCRPRRPVPRDDGAGQPRPRRLPAVRAGAGGGGGVMAADGNPAQPRSMTLMAGPVDTRINPSKVNELATGKPVAWFEKNLIATVPWRHAGAGRRVYPGFVQLLAFLSMNIARHREGAPRPLRAPEARRDRQGRGDQDLLRRVLRRARPAGGVLHRDGEAGVPGRRAGARRARLTAAAASIRGRSAAPRSSPSRANATTSARSARPPPRTTSVPRLRPYLKRHHMQVGVGHYGVLPAAGAGRRRSTRTSAT